MFPCCVYLRLLVLHQMLTEDTARNIGLAAYYPLVRKAFNDILKALDTQFGKPLMMTNTHNVNKVGILAHSPTLSLLALSR